MTVTPAILSILGAAVAPNPVRDGTAKIYIKLSAPASRIEVKVFSSSSRRVRHDIFSMGTWKKILEYDLGLEDGQGKPLANGIYHYTIEAWDGDWLASVRAGTFFILR